MTPFRVSIFAVIASLLLLFLILELIRSRRLRERYALLWLLTAVVMLVLSAWRGALGSLAGAVGIYYPPSALFVLGSLFGYGYARPLADALAAPPPLGLRMPLAAGFGRN